MTFDTIVSSWKWNQNTITMNDPNTIQQQITSSSITQSNPFGTPDPTAEFPQEIYFLDRKSTENRELSFIGNLYQI